MLNLSEQSSTSIYQYIFDLFSKLGLPAQQSHIATAAGLLLTAALLLYVLDYIMRGGLSSVNGCFGKIFGFSGVADYLSSYE